MKPFTKKFLFVGMIIYGVYDFGVFTFKGEVTTISQAMTDYLHVSKFGILCIGMVLGHFLWVMTPSEKKV